MIDLQYERAVEIKRLITALRDYNDEILFVINGQDADGDTLDSLRYIKNIEDEFPYFSNDLLELVSKKISEKIIKLEKEFSEL